jgi:aryl-alcohol dehydrogenase-like predicted oxidoreductase
VARLPGRERQGPHLRTRRLGRDGPELSTVGFGSWAIGGPWKFGWGAVDDDESVAAIRRAVELGVNWVDTAAIYGYGHSEEVVGRAVAPLRPGEEVYVFTKCGRNWYGKAQDEIENDLRPDSIRYECEQSLRRLGLDRIDLYQFHWPDHLTGTPVEESWATMGELVDEGKVRWIGVSNFDVELLARCHAVRPVDSLQPPLSLLGRGTRAEIIPHAREHGIGVITYSPLASGLLSGSFDRDRVATLEPTDWRRGSPLFQEPALSDNLELVARLREIASGLGTDVASLAIAWVLAVPGVTGAIVGARVPRHVDGWASAGDLDLGETALAEIGEALAATGAGSDEPPRPPPHMRAAAST